MLFRSYTFAWTGLEGAGAYGNRIVRIPMDQLGLGTERIEGEMAFDQKVICSSMGCFFSGAVSELSYGDSGAS